MLDAPASGWMRPALGEWTLRGQEFGDLHQHDEINYVLEGTLVVDCDGERVVATAGDVVLVPAGHAAYYSAQDFARMIFVYGPNPQGLPTQVLASRRPS